MKSIKNILKTKEILMIIFLFIFVTVILLAFPSIDFFFLKESKIYINEIVASNSYIIQDNNGDYSDYIEIYNGYDKKINLSGYHLSDNQYKPNKWTFPSIELEPHEYLIIYASGKDTCISKNKCHTNFKLNSKGETVILTDKNDNVISKVSYPDMPNDTAYGYVEKKYDILNKPSPNEKNDDTYKEYELTKEELYINEYMMYNQKSNYDILGNYSDFIELGNGSSEDIYLNNIYLSDNPDNLTKYKLPPVTIKKEEFLLIYLGDKSMVMDDHIIANFKLSENDKKLIVSNGKTIIDYVELVPMVDNVSYGRKDDNWFYFTKPTPGHKNDTLTFEKLGDIK